jgi:lipopolysaccharide export system protein LptC
MNARKIGIELNLPDLPEVPIQLGSDADAGTDGSAQARPRVRAPLASRLREGLTTYLPLLLMVLLALGTWWLVQNTPKAPAVREQAAPRAEPDYEMQQFSIQRFGADGRLKLRIDGDRLRHFPDVDRIEVEQATIRSFAPDGRETVAKARRALANGDGSEVQLLGGAEVRGRTPGGDPIEVDSEFLHIVVDRERLSSSQSVRLRIGASEMRASGIDIDQLAGRIELKGPLRGVFLPRRAVPPKEDER